jgi:hypothetical protein
VQTFKIFFGKVLTVNNPFAIVTAHTVTHTTQIMRTKTLLCLAVLAAGALTSMAQSNVYSLNVVGYYNVTCAANKYTLTANQLVQTNSQVQTLFATVPDNTQIIGWTGSAFAPDTFSGGVWDDGTESYVPGAGFFIKNNTGTPFTQTFVGEVNQNTNTTSFTSGAYKLVGLWTPQAGLLQTDFGYPAGSFDLIIKWTGAAYATYTFDPTLPGWDPEEPPVVVGDGFFVKPTGARTWTRSFKVQ